MQTDALITLLAAGAGPAPRAVVARHVWPVAALGLLLPAGFSALKWGWLPLQFWAANPGLWLKFGYVLVLSAAAGWLVARLAKPAASVRAPSLLFAGVLAAMALGSGLWWAQLAGPQQAVAFWGHSWRVCPWVVLSLALPALGAGLWVLRQLAPTRPLAAGWAVGLFAGALGASGYALACAETSPAFVAVWYSLGVLASGALGAALGPRVLRW